MTYPPYLREKARQLRTEKQLSIDEIAERLAVGRTTVFYWVGDMPRPKRCVRRKGPAHQIGTRAMQRRYKRERDEAYELGRLEFDRLCREPTFRDFVSLYIAEGYKRDRNAVAIGNSDPAVMRVSQFWIREFTRNKIGYSIQYHADQRIHELRAFWSEQLGIDGEAIRLQRKSNSRGLAGRTWRSKHGVISMRGGDTMFRARLQGWIDQIETLWLDLKLGA
jgi:AcrR family transcriptional regulator